MGNRKWTDMKIIEKEILKMRSEGKSRQEIANALNLEKKQIVNWVIAMEA